MKNKKLKVLLLATCVALPTMFGLTACGHKHDFSANWLKDADSHWHVCSDDDCSEVSDKSTHTFVAKHDSTQYWQECSVCGQQGEKTTATVNETTLKNALEFKDAEGNDYTNWEALQYNNISNDVFRKVKCTGDAYSGAVGNNELLIVNSYDGDSKVSYKYEKTSAEDNWVRTRTGSDHYSYLSKTAARNLVIKNGTDSEAVIKNLSTETFTYNEDDCAYYLTMLDSETTTYKLQYTYKLEFVNGKLVKVHIVGTKTTFATETEGEKVTTTSDKTWVFSYGNVTIEFPNLSVVGSAQWSKALSFDGVTNFTQTMENRNSENVIARKITSKITESSAYQIDVNAGGTNYNIYDLTNKKNYNKGSTGKYTKSDMASLTSFNAMLSRVGNPANLYTSIKDSFTNFTYNEDENVYYCASASIEGTTYQDVKLTFDNAKLVKAEYKKGTNNATTTWTYTYGDATVTIPSDSVCNINIAYDNSAEVMSFVMSDLTFNAKETKNFVINVTDTIFNANKDSDGKCNIIGEFGTSDSATFTIKVTNVSGTEISNSASDTNSIDCEITTAGKYYIEITASAGCTGKWDIGFNDTTPTPTAGSTKETAIAVPYSTDDKKFILNNIELSTTEKWFVFEITEDQYNTNKGKAVGCKVGGTVTVSDESGATLTIVTESEKGVTLTNASTTGGETYENLGAGKYYIKISATANCTGAISLSFLKIISA